jgi:hypothetical protein
MTYGGGCDGNGRSLLFVAGRGIGFRRLRHVQKLAVDDRIHLRL